MESNVRLLPHQVEVLRETSRLNRVGYFLDMGLGKTFVGSEKAMTLREKLVLVICQKSKVNDWFEHFFENYNGIAVMDLTKDTTLNAYVGLGAESRFPHVVGVINYEKAWRRKKLLGLKDFTLILDESSLIQNTSAKQTKFILKLNPTNVILLSGTPTAGKYENLWSQAHLLGWDLLEKTFLDQYVNWEKIDIGGQTVRIVDRRQPYRNVDRMKQKLAEHGAVFLKTEEVLNLPEQIWIPVKVKQSAEYQKFCRDHVLILSDTETLVGDTKLSDRLCKRKLCGMYSKEKLQAFHDLVQSTEDNLVVFYNFTQEMNELKEICESLNRKVSVINGQRKDPIEGSNVLLVQYQAGAYGLNLQNYSNKIIYFTIPDKSELWEQSQKRIHRIGQQKTCMYYVMLVKNSVETEEILPTLRFRKELTNDLFTDGVVPDRRVR